MNEVIYEGKYLYIPDRYFHENLKSRFVRKIYEIEESVMIKNYFDKNDQRIKTSWISINKTKLNYILF